MTVNTNQKYFTIWMLASSIISFLQVMEISSIDDDSIGIDYAEEGNNSFFYDYEEESSEEYK